MERIAALLLLLEAGSAVAATMLNPLYIYPLSSRSDYINVSSASLLFPVVIVLNPANGQPECPKNSDWERALQQIAAAKDAGGNVKAIGYVSTDYTNVAIATAKAHVDTYFQCWNVSGIFFDEAENDQDHLAYYQELHNYVHGKLASATVVINPGTATIEEYMNACDINVIFESPGSSWAQYAAPGWAANYPPSRLAMIVHSVNTAPEMESILANATARGIGVQYVTDSGYTSLPAFWPEEVAFFAANAEPGMSSDNSGGGGGGGGDDGGKSSSTGAASSIGTGAVLIAAALVAGTSL